MPSDGPYSQLVLPVAGYISKNIKELLEHNTRIIDTFITTLSLALFM